MPGTKPKIFDSPNRLQMVLARFDTRAMESEARPTRGWR